MNDPRGHRSLPYSPDAYDEHFALRIPLVLWLVMLYAVYPQILLLLGHLPQSGAEVKALLSLVDVYALVAALPAVLVLIAAARRRPAAGGLVRGVWRQGRWLLMLTLVANLVPCVLNPHGIASALRMVADLTCATLLLTAPRLRDTFADFPNLPF